MSANLPRPSSVENVSSTLTAGISDVATTFDIADASNIVQPCYLVIDRVDSSGTVKSTSLWEYIKVTNVAGNTLTVTRGVNGSTNQSHSAGAVIEAVVTSAHFEDWYAALNPEHDSAGGHVITGTMTVAGMNLSGTATMATMAMTSVASGSPVVFGVGLVGGALSRGDLRITGTSGVSVSISNNLITITNSSAAVSTGRTLRQIVDVSHTAGARATTISSSLVSVPTSAATIVTGLGSDIFIDAFMQVSNVADGQRINARLLVDGTGVGITNAYLSPDKADNNGLAGIYNVRHVVTSVTSGSHYAYLEFASTDAGDLVAVGNRRITIQEYL